MAYVREGEAGQRSLLSMNEVLENVISFTGEQLKFAKIKVAVEYRSGLPLISATCSPFSSIINIVTTRVTP